jgi:antitoxin VapB
MHQVAKLFTNGRSQAVRLPAVFRFDTKEVYIRQDAETGDVILSRKPPAWDEFFAVLATTDVPAEFLSPAERASEEPATKARDPFAEWRE